MKSCLVENEAVIDRVFIHFVFRGDPEEAERSQVLDKFREDLENKKYLIDQRFGRPVTMVIEFRSLEPRRSDRRPTSEKRTASPMALADTVTRYGPNGEKMTIGFIRLVDLHEMYRDMGVRFFERNIRAACRKAKQSTVRFSSRSRGSCWTVKKRPGLRVQPQRRYPVCRGL